MNYEVTCGLCNHLFSSPIIVKCCSSSVCLNCLNTICYQKDKTSDKFFYNCPFCKKECEERDSTSPNDFLAVFIANNYSSEGSLFYECERCEKKTGCDNIVICSECNNKSLCQECSDTIHSIGKFRLHERSCFTQGVVHQSHYVTKLINCNTHVKEKIEYICLKDSQFLCNLCITSHKQSCKQNITTIKEAYKDLLSQLKIKSEKLNYQKLSLKSDDNTLKASLENLEENCKKIKFTLESQFAQLHTILNQKQKEIEFSIEYAYIQRQLAINQEIQSIKDACLWIDNLMDIISFASSYQNPSLIQGAKYLSSRIDSLMNALQAKKIDTSDLGSFPSLINIEECKTMLYKIALSAPTIIDNNEKAKPTRVPTPKSSTPTTTPPRSVTPQTNKYQRSDTPVTSSPHSKSRESLKTYRANFRSFINHKETSDPCISKFELSGQNDKKDIQVVSSRMQIEKFSEALNSPRFSTSQSFISSSRGQDENDEGITIEKVLKKPSRMNSSSSSTFSTYLSQVGAGTSSFCTSHGINLQSVFVKANDPKKKRPSFTEIKRCKNQLNDSKEETMSNTLADLNHLTELQKNPLIKRVFSKIAPTATTILVAWTHPFNISNVIYQLEYGIGTKVQGVEQFRSVFKGPLQSCIISDLMPKTTYRIRVCAILLKNKDGEAEGSSMLRDKKELQGEWSDIISVTTKEPQSLDLDTLGNHAKMSARGGEKVHVEFDKSGTVTANNGYTYGKVAWEVKLQQQSAHQMTDDTSSFIKIGVMSKGGKQSNVIGSMINYGMNFQSSTINVILDMENKTLTIQPSNSPNKEVFNNLPDGPLYPAFQNKTNKNPNFSIKLFVHFDLPVK